MAKNRPFLTGDWRWLVMFNYQVPPEVVQPYVPAGTVLDDWEGKFYISLVGFLFLDTKVWGLPLPWHRNFEEVNLRFYVRRKHPEGDRRAVCFIKEIVPRWAIATTAKLLYNENYVALPMRHVIDRAGLNLQPNGRVEYEWRTGTRWNRMAVRSTGDLHAMQPGSVEEFITEHFWGYCTQRDGGTLEYEVEHPAWRVWQVAESEISIDYAGLYGEHFAPWLEKKPSSVLLAEGSPLTVHYGTRIAT